MSEEKKEEVVVVEEAKTEAVTEVKAEVNGKKTKVKRPKSKARKIVEWVLTGLFVVIFGFILVAQIDGMVHKKDHYNQTIRFGYGTFVVQTDSMEPNYKVGTALITYLEDADKIYQAFQKHENVDLTFVDCYEGFNEYTVPDPNGTNKELVTRTARTGVPMTHRVREIHVNESLKKGEGRYTFITAGINTKSKMMGYDKDGYEHTIDQYQAFTEKEILGRVVINSAFLGGVFSFVSSIFGLLVLLLIPAFYLVITSVIDIFKAYKEPEANTSNGEKPVNKGTIDLSEEDKKRLKEELLDEMINKQKGDK